MTLQKSVCAVACFLALGVSQASAQEPSRWITGQAGLTTGSSSWLVAGEAGGRVNPVLGLYGSFGRMADAAPKEIKDAAAAMGADLEMAMPTIYGVGGMKLYAPTGGIKPYGLVGLGFARITPRYIAGGTDVTSQVESVVGSTAASGRVLEFGGGVEIAGPMLLDLGYRVMRFGGSHSVSRLHAAVGVAF